MPVSSQQPADIPVLAISPDLQLSHTPTSDGWPRSALSAAKLPFCETVEATNLGASAQPWMSTMSTPYTAAYGVPTVPTEVVSLANASSSSNATHMPYDNASTTADRCMSFHTQAIVC